MVPVLMLYLRLQCTSTVSILPVVPVVGRPCCTTGNPVVPVRYRSICSTPGFPRWADAYLSFCLSHFDSTGSTGTSTYQYRYRYSYLAIVIWLLLSSRGGGRQDIVGASASALAGASAGGRTSASR